MTPFVFNTTKSVVFENGAAVRLAELAGGLLGRNCLLITDPGLRALGLCDPAIAALQAAGPALSGSVGSEALFQGLGQIGP